MKSTSPVFTVFCECNFYKSAKFYAIFRLFW